MWKGAGMSERKIVVPGDMLAAAYSANEVKLETVQQVLEAALLWLSENPIMPTPEECRDMIYRFGLQGERSPHDDRPRISPTQAHNLIVNWQRRMFLAPQPEIPEAVRDLLYPDFTSAMDIVSDVKPTRTEARYQQSILEAYRRGQNSTQKAK